MMEDATEETVEIMDEYLNKLSNEPCENSYANLNENAEWRFQEEATFTSMYNNLSTMCVDMVRIQKQKYEELQKHVFDAYRQARRRDLERLSEMIDTTKNTLLDKYRDITDERTRSTINIFDNIFMSGSVSSERLSTAPTAVDAPSTLPSVPRYAERNGNATLLRGMMRRKRALRGRSLSLQTTARNKRTAVFGGGIGSSMRPRNRRKNYSNIKQQVRRGNEVPSVTTDYNNANYFERTETPKMIQQTSTSTIKDEGAICDRGNHSGIVINKRAVQKDRNM